LASTAYRATTNGSTGSVPGRRSILALVARAVTASTNASNPNVNASSHGRGGIML